MACGCARCEKTHHKWSELSEEGDCSSLSSGELLGKESEQGSNVILQLVVLNLLAVCGRD